jgi:ABC-type dipeptide/oligopeptide/nickel transport system permease subunit
MSGLLPGRATPSLWFGGVTVVLLLLVAFLAPWLAPYPPEQVLSGGRLEPPGLLHPFGTDSLGRDLLSRVLFGARIALETAALGAGISAGLGISLGLLAGFYRDWVDQLLSRVIEIWLAMPGLLFAIVIVARLGPSLRNAAIALGIIGVPSFFRLARSGALSARESAYVAAARSLGAADTRIITRHILPNLAPSLVVLATMRLGVMVLASGGLSFIGLGAQPPEPEWGALLADGRSYMGVAPWLAIYPGLCITLTVVGLNLFGDGLRDMLDPWRRPGQY